MPDGIREGCGAGIVDPRKSIARDAGNGRDIGIPNPLLRYGAMGRGHASTGGGFPGARVGKQNGQTDTSMNNGAVPHGVEPVMEPPEITYDVKASPEITYGITTRPL